VCCDINGTTLWTFTDTSVSKDQRSIAVDDYGNVYVVGPRSANVIVISPDGKKHKQLLSKTDRLDNPWALHYDCMVVQCSRTMLDELLSAGWYVMTNGTLLFVFFSLYRMRSLLSIPLALLKQWLMLALL
jgi:hypothetical protein